MKEIFSNNLKLRHNDIDNVKLVLIILSRMIKFFAKNK